MNSYSDNWGIYLFRGILALIIAILALLMPGVTFATLVIFFAAYMLVDGIFSIIMRFSVRKH